MFLTLLLLLQPRGASWRVWTVVILLFIIGVAAIIYLSKRLRKNEDNDESWTLAQRSMINISESPKTVDHELPEDQINETPIEKVPATVEVAKPQVPEKIKATIESTPEPLDKTNIRETQAFASIREEKREEPPADTQQLAAVKEPAVAKTEILSSVAEPQEPVVVPPPVEPVRETRETEMLVSQPSESTPHEAAETTPFGDEIWSEIESRLQPTSPASEPVEEPIAETEAPEEIADEIYHTAKVEDRAPVEHLRVESGTRREPFEPPTIAPLESREQPPAAARQTKPMSRPTAFTPAPRDLPVDNKRPPETRVERPAPRVEQVPAEAARLETAEPAIAIQKAASRKASGAVLGLPVDSSDQPLILGTPARNPEEQGIGSLTNYGRSMDQEGGRWGTITLAVMVLLVVGGIAAYRYSPWFHSKIDGIVTRFVGSAQTENASAPKPEIPRAQIYPRPGEANKNMVKARGSVINITEEGLTGLAVEVNLTRSDGSTESRTVPVNPPQLAARQQGIYEFEYDGKQFTGYSVSKLTSDGTEIKFIIPGRR
jgi:hypothetical protein